MPDPVDATPVAGKQVLGALDRHAVTERSLKHRQFNRAQPGARRSRFTDRAMVLDEQIAAALLSNHLSHVPFRGALSGQGLDAFPERN